MVVAVMVIGAVMGVMSDILSSMFFFFKQKTAYEIGVRLVGSEMCIRDRVMVEGVPTRRLFVLFAKFVLLRPIRRTP